MKWFKQIQEILHETARVVGSLVSEVTVRRSDPGEEVKYTTNFKEASENGYSKQRQI